jgi:crotonobetainyl-CoA:carnitine CoA-transferase CaiB-like acyl-CoA transferase
MGKYCAYLDLGQPDQLATMHRLCSDADVFATSYRGTVNERFGLRPQELAGRSARGIVAMTVNAYGHAGPWADRPGFDPNAQAASGFASTEGGSAVHPKLSPVVYLADLMTGYFAAAGMMAALLRRSREGGSWHVKVSLARSAMWVQSLGLWPEDEIDSLPVTDHYPYRATSVPTAFGEVTTLCNAVRYEGLVLQDSHRLVPYGPDGLNGDRRPFALCSLAVIPAPLSTRASSEVLTARVGMGRAFRAA